MADRRSRHYYDLVRLYEHGIGRRALQDTQLLADFACHKSLLFPATAAHYELAKPGTFKLEPPATQVEALRRDYQGMAEMFFTSPPPFELILERLGAMAKIINHK